MGHTAEEKIKILYEDSLRDIRNLTGRLELVEKNICDKIDVLPSLADKEMQRAGKTAMRALAGEVGSIARNLAGYAAEAEKATANSVAAKWATVGVLACAVVFGGTGYVVRMATDQVNLNAASRSLEKERAQSATEIAEVENNAHKKIEDMQKSIGWLGTADGQLARKFFESGEGKVAAQCTAETWDIKTIDNVKYCVPRLKSIFGKDGVYGWRIP